MAMTPDYDGGTITSTVTLHTATRAPEGHWTVSWLPGRALDYNAAITAMTLAEKDADADYADRQTQLALVSLAAELGLQYPEVAGLLEQNVPA
ncbi:hypothetical protein, partial [Micromonospora harpali]